MNTKHNQSKQSNQGQANQQRRRADDVPNAPMTDAEFDRLSKAAANGSLPPNFQKRLQAEKERRDALLAEEGNGGNGDNNADNASADTNQNAEAVQGPQPQAAQAPAASAPIEQALVPLTQAEIDYYRNMAQSNLLKPETALRYNIGLDILEAQGIDISKYPRAKLAKAIQAPAQAAPATPAAQAPATPASQAAQAAQPAQPASATPMPQAAEQENPLTIPPKEQVAFPLTKEVTQEITAVVQQFRESLVALHERYGLKPGSINIQFQLKMEDQEPTQAPAQPAAQQAQQPTQPAATEATEAAQPASTEAESVVNELAAAAPSQQPSSQVMH